MSTTLTHGSRRRSGRPPAGTHPGDKVKHYPQVSLRIPPECKTQLQALSIAQAKPQWRIILGALECLIRESPDAEKRESTG
jgi:hypothetical protein